MSNLSIEEQKEFLQIACNVAKNSPDLSTQNGAVLVKTTFGNSDSGFRRNPTLVESGYNRFPVGVNSDINLVSERFQRRLKYTFTEHAERNCLYDAARFGIQTQGLILVCSWITCSDCARGIIECGIHEIITLKPKWEHKAWDDSIANANIMLNEAGIKITYFEGKLFDDKEQVTLLFNGKKWMP